MVGQDAGRGLTAEGGRAGALVPDMDRPVLARREEGVCDGAGDCGYGSEGCYGGGVAGECLDISEAFLVEEMDVIGGCGRGDCIERGQGGDGERVGPCGERGGSERGAGGRVGGRGDEGHGEQRCNGAWPGRQGREKYCVDGSKGQLT